MEAQSCAIPAPMPVGGAGGAGSAFRRVVPRAETRLPPAARPSGAVHGLRSGRAAPAADVATTPPPLSQVLPVRGSAAVAPGPTAHADRTPEQLAAPGPAAAAPPGGSPVRRPSEGLREGLGGATLSKLPAMAGLHGDARVVFEAAAAAGVRPGVLARSACRVGALLQP